MQLADFDFDLPEALIALRPLRPRPASKLLVARGAVLSDAHVSDLPAQLSPGDLLVFNDTKVIPARLSGTRQRSSAHGSGTARIEVTLIRKSGEVWYALARPAKRLTAGDVIAFAHGLEAQVLDRSEGEVKLQFNFSGPGLDTALERSGQMPLPPYIAQRRAVDAQDREDYQTVFAARTGAVAAPTASLHFDATLLDQLSARGVNSTRVTLHVGAGTFLPVKVEDISTHKMHSEWGEISAEAATAIADTRAAGGKIIPVGTTALRLIETAATAPGRIAPFTGDTDIFITPGYQFQITDALMTNFHLPKSTLLMLVSALMGHEQMRAIYAHAIAQNYRFFSYGDSSLLFPQVT